MPTWWLPGSCPSSTEPSARREDTPGSQLLAEACTAANYSVTFPAHGPDELGVMIISKVATTPDHSPGH